ncbi:LuxR C-terminal-related transcriptional regulator [Streptosporangium sp. NBC_01639]|uniref:helix-turn-helix transcriptional regulator n=1 Tax=unclassified Streptosporangium TaxID=2632669 RepID=UPI002DDBA154|nr:LuxR C-terminal-related transcriptional regulator [Streptosporangium sp. NBC_01756]WSC85946.1 LuxR C-terminal-related transcriptional regulator [Streptosporangium sp. NBC_01756]WTD55380.1 LuxR C-terminal-related transcriptional regulator [Streptosporangium sp. NBC_01639]
MLEPHSALLRGSTEWVKWNMEQRRLLEGLGVAVAEETTYRALLRHGPATLNQLAFETGTSAAVIRRMFPRMEDLGLVTRVAGRPLRLIATPPNVAIDILVARRHEEIAHSRAAAALLATEVVNRSGPHPEEVLEVVTGREAVGRRFQQIERNTTEELLVLVHPPYAVDVSGDQEDRRHVVHRRARTRGIYGPLAFEEPGMLEHTRLAIKEGEEARLGQVPVKLAVADARVAMLPLVSDENRAVESALVVHPSALLDALVGLFEVLWQSAIPLHGTTTPTGESLESETWSQPSDAEVLALLAAGLKDNAIARQLGISPRTVQRRVQVLCERLGARSRFHAGLLVGRHNLLGP